MNIGPKKKSRLIIRMIRGVSMMRIDIYKCQCQFEIDIYITKLLTIILNCILNSLVQLILELAHTKDL